MEKSKVMKGNKKMEEIIKNKNLLIGKFVFITTGQYYKYGEVIECVDREEQYFLIRIASREDGGPENTSTTLYNINQMLQADEEPDSDGVIWMFFDTRKELDKYVKWIETPSKTEEKKVVNLSLVRSKDAG